MDWEELLTCPCLRFRFSPGHLWGRYVQRVCPPINWRRVFGGD